jgi:formate dehydrogenase major subunit
VAALAESFGRGAMTNHWIDLKNSDCILIMGSNAAENHPISFKWVTKAKDAGATLIHVDPRFTRTSAKADIFTNIRSGADIAFLGGLIKYILDKKLFFKDYILDYTNISFVLGKDYAFKDGLFSGFDPKTAKYDTKAWAFEMDKDGNPVKDRTLKNKRCVYQLLKQHYSRYDLDKVESITGTPKKDLIKVYEAYAATGKPDKSGTIMYAMGWTQHTVGVQNIRTMAMIQLLLGNIGVAGGGVNALRGESNVQGSTDHCLLVHILPGYLGTPAASMATLSEYNKAKTPTTNDPMSANWWGNYAKYSASLIKAMYPEASLDEGYKWLPKLDDGVNYTWLVMFDKMLQGQFKGFFAWGQNPACGGANANKTREALGKLDWLVNVNIFDNETASFWKGPGMDPKSIKTEVFMMPCAVSIEKEGSITNSGRWMQWRYAGPKPLGETKPDGDIIYELYEKIRELYEKEGGAMPEPIKALNWEQVAEKGVYAPHKVAKLINGYFLKDVAIKDKTYAKGSLVPSFAFLQDDGSTCSANWLYCGSYTEKGNMSARRDKKQNDAQANIGLYPGWSWCWPVNRRILYNRASVDLKGKPWAPKKAVIEWNAADKKWVGDVPDGGWAPGTKHAFIMKPSGFSHIFGPGRSDGPFPEYYEPMECPVEKHPFSKQLHNPTALQFKTEEKAVCDPRYPFVCSTYRVTEHWQTGVMTRWTPWLLEAEPQMFCEMSPELAELRGIKNGEKVWLENPRGKLWAIAIVTSRLRPFKIQGQTVHQVGIPWHYGWVHPKEGGDSANILTPSVGDSNTGIPETKAFMVNVTKA